VVTQLKGTVAREMFEAFSFFHQTTPPGPLKGYLPQAIRIFSNFHGAIQILK